MTLCVRLGTILFVSLSIAAGLRECQAQQVRRWVAPQNVVDVLRNGGNYTTYLGNTYFDYGKGGKTLSTALTSFGSHAAAVKGIENLTRTNVPDGGNNECVAFARGCTGAPGSTKWRRGPQVMSCSTVLGGVTPGTLIATFVADRAAPGGYRYSGHTALFAGYTSSGGISFWDQNWLLDKTIVWHRIESTCRGNLSDAFSYFVVETAK